MDDRTNAATQTKDRDLVITRVFDAPRRLVFKAWTDPERLAQWWGPRGFTTPFCEMDVRPGGAFRFGMRSAQGTDHWLRDEFRKIVEPERLVCTFASEYEKGKPGQETLLTVTF